ncbi:hypothetical protein CP533_4613 [Ophiocordyceps camponoti-saundersi (nom. inval.)]|nr:hypothetical protein CP533_4613 [Ophiocordyceps camponoti-saundersi (nom. inval.)]
MAAAARLIINSFPTARNPPISSTALSSPSTSSLASAEGEVKILEDVELTTFYAYGVHPLSSSRRRHSSISSTSSSSSSSSTSSSSTQGMTIDKRQRLADEIWRQICHPKVKAAVTACTFGLAVVFGALLGATLKGEKQKIDAYNKFNETSPEDKISALEEHKDQLLQEKAALENRMVAFRRHIQERQEEKLRFEAEWRRRKEEWRLYDEEQKRRIAERERRRNEASR